jgi:hypothetical protein
MISRQSLTAAAFGLLAGLLGAVAAAAITGRVARPDHPERPPAAPRAPIVPPGWDPRVGEQVASLERRMTTAEAALGRQLARPAAGAAAPEHGSRAETRPQPREQGRLEHYQRQLETYARRVEDHQKEPIDSAWSAQAAESIRSQLSGSDQARSFELKDVDCRSKTCLATLTFASPAEALVFVAQADSRVMSRACNYWSITPPPPAGEGRYDLPIYYDCR